MIMGWEWIIVLVVIVLLLFGGGKKIPEFARGLGRAMGEFQRGKMELERELREEGALPKIEDESEVVKAAKALGIDTKDKTEEELKKEIAEKMESEDAE